MNSTEVFALAIQHWPISKAQELAAEHAAISHDTIPCPPPEGCEDETNLALTADTDFDLSPTLTSGPRVERATAVLPAPRGSVHEVSDVLW